MTADPYHFWQSQIAGTPIDLDDKLPRVGFYRKSDQPIAIWMAGDDMVAKVGKGRVQPADAGFAEQVFAWCCRNAVSHSTYTAVMEGGQWPDDIESLDDARSNFPTDPFDALLAELDLLEMKIAEFLKTQIAIGDEVRALQADRWKARAKKVEDDLEVMRDAKRKPLNEELKEIQRVFLAEKGRASTLVTKLLEYVGPHVTAKKRKVEADALAKREAEIAAATAMGETVPPPRAEPRGRSKVAVGGTTVVTRKEAELTDIPKVAAFFAGFEKPPEKLQAVLKALAKDSLVAGFDVPGAKIIIIESVR